LVGPNPCDTFTSPITDHRLPTRDMRSESDFSASESQGISTRAWLYVGALLVGFSLASMADFDAIDAAADEPSAPRSTRDVSDEAVPPATTRAAANGPDRSALRSVVLDTGPRVSVRTP
jgi:hypothetical protein